MRRIRRRSAPEVVAQGETDVCRKRQLASPAGFSRRHRHRVVLPIEVADPKPCHLNGPQAQINQAKSDGVVSSPLFRLAVKGGEERSALHLVQDLRANLPPEVGDAWDRMHECRGTSAPQMHEAQKLSQAGERAIDTLRVQHATLPGGVTTQIFWPHPIPSQRSTLKLPCQILTNDTQRSFARAGRQRPIDTQEARVVVEPRLPAKTGGPLVKPSDELEPSMQP